MADVCEMIRKCMIHQVAAVDVTSYNAILAGTWGIRVRSHKNRNASTRPGQPIMLLKEHLIIKLGAEV